MKRKKIAFLLIAALLITMFPGFSLTASAASASELRIRTVAGSYNAGDGGAATTAQINCPTGVAVDSSGNLYVADSGNSTVRKIDTSGNITTVAGTGAGGFSGDGGAATAAQLNNPFTVTIDGSGNLYIADNGNYRVRKVDTSGIITTVAGSGTSGYSGDGGPAVEAKVSYIWGIAIDGSGNLYLGDRDNNRVRKVDTGGIITTVAGNGTNGSSGDGGPATGAAINGPSGLDLNAVGDLYIAESFGNRIRKVDNNGIISTVAGTGSAGYSGDNGAATAAELNNPYGVAVDDSGNIYIGDSSNSCIRMVSAGGTITTLAGSGTYGYSGDGGPADAAEMNFPIGLALDGSGNLYFADQNNNRIRRIDLADKTISTVAGSGIASYSGDGGAAASARLYGSNGLAFDSSGNLYIADSSNNRIRKINAVGVISTVAGNGTSGFSGDGGQAAAAELCYPIAVAADSSGNLYIADSENDRIRKVDTSGIITTVAGDGNGGYTGDGGQAAAAEIGYPQAVAVDSAGNLYIADSGNNVIRKVDTSGVITTVAGNGNNGYSGDGGPATAAALNYPYGISVDSSGSLYISDCNNNVIRKVGTDGIISTVAGTGTSGYAGDGGLATGAALSYPNSVVTDGSGNLYIADGSNNVIRKVDTAGIISTIAGTGVWSFSGDGGLATAATFSWPVGLVLDSSGNLYFSDCNNNRIREIYTYTADSGNSGSSGSSGNSGSSGSSTRDSSSAAAETTSTNTNGVSTVTATVKTAATVGTDGRAAAAVTSAQMTATLKDAVENAAKQGTEAKAVVEIKVSSAGSPSNISTTIPQASFDSLTAGGADALKISTAIGTVTMDSKALSAISGNTSADVTITVAQADSSVLTLSEADQKELAGRPIYTFSVTSGGKTVSEFGGGTATVSVPYTLGSGEDGSKVVIYYISDSGELTKVTDCVYDPTTKSVRFVTPHFSSYAVGYSNISFSDVSGWYADAVNFLVAREIISGTGDGTFDPNANITRAQFVTILAKLSGDSLSGYTSSSFTDVSASDWYFGAAQWAYENGVASGAAGRFDANATITRQDMAVMIARYAEKIAKYELPETADAVTFTDSGKIDSYASAAVTAMQRAEIISGNSDGSFAPKANATRAAAAKMIAAFLQNMVSE